MNLTGTPTGMSAGTVLTFRVIVRPNIFFKTKALVSTTIKKEVITKCCVQEITVLPGTKMIWMEGLTYSVGEFEFLLSSNTITKNLRNIQKKNLFMISVVPTGCH